MFVKDGLTYAQVAAASSPIDSKNDPLNPLLRATVNNKKCHYPELLSDGLVGDWADEAEEAEQLRCARAVSGGKGLCESPGKIK